MNNFSKVGYFDHTKYSTDIELIHNEKNRTIKEKYFKEIAKDIILSETITDKIFEGPNVKQIQGVPFDLIGVKGNDIYIIELKGSDQDLNFPKEVQLVRMEKLIAQAKKQNIILKPLLFQINLKYCFYCIWPAEFLANCFKYVDKRLGTSKTFERIVRWIEEFLVDRD